LGGEDGGGVEIKKFKNMTYSIIKESTMWSTDSLKKKVEEILNEKTKDGYEVVTVSFGLNMWWMPTAFITLRK
jgi:translation elongation factor EF-1beta